MVSGTLHMGQFQRFEEKCLMKMCSPISGHMSDGKRYSTHRTVPQIWIPFTGLTYYMPFSTLQINIILINKIKF
jgi:hypothetical protein